MHKWYSVRYLYWYTYHTAEEYRKTFLTLKALGPYPSNVTYMRKDHV